MADSPSAIARRIADGQQVFNGAAGFSGVSPKGSGGGCESVGTVGHGPTLSRATETNRLKASIPETDRKYALNWVNNRFGTETATR